MNPEPTAYLVVPSGDPDAAPLAVLPAAMQGMMTATIHPLFKRDDIAPLRVPLIDQHDRLVGYHNRKAADLLSEQALTDVHGTVWLRPTADAYQRLCVAHHAKTDECAMLRNLLARIVAGATGIEEAKALLEGV